MKALPQPPVLVITDRRQATKPLLSVAVSLFEGGCRWISLREPDLPSTERINLLYRLVNYADRWKARVFVHADYDAAMTTGAAGVHLPRAGSIKTARDFLGSAATVGISAHNRNEAEHAAALGADYVTLSPIFETQSKPGYGPALGLRGLSAVARTVPIPVLALGGIDAGNAAHCLAAGAAGVAIMGAAMRADDPESMIRAVIEGVAKPLVTPGSGGHSDGNMRPPV